MNNKKILIDASNLFNGGGVQVAANYLNLLLAEEDLSNLEIHVSNKVLLNMCPEALDKNTTTKIVKYDKIKSFTERLFDSKQKNFYCTFSIFGPNYSLLRSKVSITGFAQPWIIYPNNEIYKKLSPINKIKTKIKYNIQLLFFRRDNCLIVEHENVKKRLQKVIKKPIFVVHNAIAEIFSKPHKWQDISIKNEPKNESLKIGIISRDYPHKNIDILPRVKEILESKYKIKSIFIVTFTKSEWSKKSEHFKNNIENIGEINLDQCPSFYKYIDIAIFPSLLECFSASPLEAIFCETPLVASNKSFVKDVCKKFARYFNPTDPLDIAKSIYEYTKSPINQERSKKGVEFIVNNFNNKNRYIRYNQIIKNALN